MALWDNINYTADISYLANTFITEYDISKCNINILFIKGVIDKATYDFLYGAERMQRQKYIGMLQKDARIADILKAGIIEAKKMLFEANGIRDADVLSIKNDAVFIINRKLAITKFGLIEFVPKNVYTAFYRIYNCEYYYYYNNVTKEEYLDVKGIKDEIIDRFHKDSFLQLLKDIFYSIQVNGPEISLRMLKDYYMDYIQMKLPLSHYRTFDETSMYHMNCRTNIGTGFSCETIPESMKHLIDITYNASLLVHLQKILVSMYFVKHK